MSVYCSYTELNWKPKMVIRNSSDFNPNFDVLMLVGRESERTLYRKHGILRSFCSFSYLLHHKCVWPSRRDQNLQNLHFTRFFDIVGCQHLLTFIITAKHPLVWISSQISMHMTSAHMYTTIQTITWMWVNYRWQAWHWNWWHSLLCAWKSLTT